METGHVSTGHPVDLATGAVFTVSEDFNISGSVPIVWHRRYSSDSQVVSWHGHKWFVPYFMTVERTAEGLAFTNEIGGQIPFPLPEPNQPLVQPIRVLGANVQLTVEGNSLVILHWHFGGEEIERFRFEAARPGFWRLRSIENLAGHTVTVHYDQSSRPVRITQDLERRTLELTYSGMGFISEISLVRDDGSNIRLAAYQYDTSGDLVGATDGEGNATTYAYDILRRMTAERNPLGSTFRFIYDANGRCVYTTGNDGYMERRIDYFTAPYHTKATDSLGNVSTYFFNPAGQLLQELSPAGAVTTTQYDEHGRPVAVIYPDAAQISYSYNETGDRVAMTDEAGAAIQMEYDSLHLPVKFIDANSAEYQWEYDERGNLLAMRNPLGSTWRYVRDQRGLVSEAHTPGGLVVKHRYDTRMRWEEAEDQISLIERIEYDDLGEIKSVTNAAGQQKQYERDRLGRVTRATYEDGYTCEFRYNGIGLLLARRGAGNDRELYRYDALGRIVEHINAMDSVMRFEYDTEDHLTAVINRAGERLERKYDPEGRISEELTFDGRVEKFEYTLRGSVRKITRSDARTIEFEFDPCEQVVSRTTSDGRVDRYKYDKNGYVVSAVSPDVSIQLERNALGRVTAEAQSGYRIEYAYDADVNRVRRRIVAAGGNEIRIGYDLRGRLTSISDGEGRFVDIGWDDLDRLTSRRTSDGLTEQLAYNAADRVISQAVRSTHYGSIVQRDYTYDANGNVTALADTRHGASDCAYDDLNRLVSWKANRDTRSFRYNAVGAIEATEAGPRRLAAGGRTLADENREFEYGADGNIAQSRSGTLDSSFEWNALGQLTAAQSDGKRFEWKYDALGRRVAMRADGGAAEIVWSGCLPAAEASQGKILRSFFSLDWLPLCQWEGGQRRVLVSDCTDAVREVLDERGRLTWSCRLDPYGRLLRSAGAEPSPFRFSGQWDEAETGLHYNFYRWYDPNLGDYIAPDPIGLQGGSNFYAYVRNPLSWNDPFGLKCGNTNKHGDDTEKAMDRSMAGKGYRKVGGRRGAQGIDGVYYKRGGKPPYMIVEAKYGSSKLSRTVPPDSARQMSDHWIDSPIAGRGDKRLDEYCGTRRAQQIRNAGDKGNVGKALFHQDENGNTSYTSLGNYNPGSGDKEVHRP
jgi:RHS repeat-associated protein